MSTSLVDQNSDVLLKARLQQVEDSLRSMQVSTRQEALASVYSALNRVLALGNNVTPLKAITAFTPAIAGHLSENFTILNDDAQSILKQLLLTEQDFSELYDLFASVQNNLRQSIRKGIYASGRRLFREEFVNADQIDTSSTVTIDFGASAAFLPLTSETVVAPDSLEPGLSSIGTLSSGTLLADLSDGKDETSITWTGSRLEIVATFNTPKIVNRVRIEMPGFQGLSLAEFSSTPDGVLREDLLAELPAGSASVDGSSNNFCGDWIADFDPRFMQQCRIILADVAANSEINLRNLTFSARKYSASGLLQSAQIDTSGKLLFRCDQRRTSPLTSVSHQFSTDGVHYTAAVPDREIDVGAGPFWYRSQLGRSDNAFSTASSTTAVAQDPDESSNYTLGPITAVDLSGGIVERTVQLLTITGSITLQEDMLPDTLDIYQGTILLDPATYQVTGRTITLPGTMTGVMLRYQISSYGSTNLVSRKDYFSPIVSSIQFESVS